MEEEGQLDMTLRESEADEAILERASDGTEEVGGNPELELPNALQDLLRRLSGVLLSDEEDVTEIPDLGDTKYGDFFEGKGESATRSEVRLKVFEAIGNCKTLRKFNNSVLGDYELSLREWEAILIPMQNNLEVEEIEWSTLASAQIEEEIAPFLHDLFAHAHNLVSLRIDIRYTRVKLAAAVASGLRVNKHHRLKKLDIVSSRTADATVVADIAEIISLAPELSDLALRVVCCVEENAKEALTAALKGCFSLRRLVLGAIQVEEIVDSVAEVYGRTCPRPFLESLTLWNVEGLTGDVLGLLIGSNILRIHVHHGDYFSMDAWVSIGKLLLQPLTICALKISFSLAWWSKEDALKMEKGVAELWRVSEKNPILDISFSSITQEEGRILETSDDQLIFLENALNDSYLKKISFYPWDISLLAFQSFVENLASNTSVRTLVVRGSRSTSSKDGWAHLFRHLRDNTSIAKLKLSSCKDLSNEDFRELMDLLQINFTLQEIDLRGTEWENEGKDALVREALERNKKLAGYFSILGEANLPFEGARAGRIFMCGAPFAGKTQLKVAMMKTMEKESKSESLISVIKEKAGKTISKLRPRRTKGIEVELLCDDKFVTISLWDFAGQEIFRALQNILFPKVNQACIFVFVFNPLETKGKVLKDDLNNVFAEELGSWLRFVASNTQITGRILPQVFIVVTHIDKLKKHQIKFDLIFQDLENIVKSLQIKFRDVVDISPKGLADNNRLIYYVNARDPNDVQPITNLVVSSMRDVLAKRSSKVPTVCSELVSQVLQGPKEAQLEPLWSCDRFYDFCSRSQPHLENFKLTDKKHKRVLKAVASYLHDAGAICMTPSAFIESDDSSEVLDNLKRLIVVDLNWLTQSFLGQLISLGHDFEVSDGVSTSEQSRSRLDEQGFINHQQLMGLIDRILQKHDRRKKVDHEMVRELLLELDLCYCLESAPGIRKYFMPIIFSGGPRTSKALPMSNLKWRMEPREGSDHFGYRVQCYDKERTSLSPALFPRYQIHLRKEMEANHGVIDGNFIFSLSHVEIGVEGCWILVEIDESRRNHIDVMVNFFKPKTRDWAMNFVQNHIVKSFTDFCASEKGCPGMQLVVAVLRTDCVKELTPRKLREESQSMLLEELKRKFQIYIEDQLKDGKLDGESVFDHVHHWPGISAHDYPEFSLPPGAEPAQTLLSSEEVNDVVTAVHTNHEDLWRNLEGLRAVSDRLGNACKEHPCSLLSPIGEEHSSSEEVSSKREHKSYSLASVVSRPSFQKRGDLTVGEKLLLRGLNEVQENMMANFAQVREDLRHFKSSLKELESGMSKVNSTVDRIIRYKISGGKHRCPRRPYFSPDGSLSRKVKATVLSSHAVRLHLMCEARNGPHFVKEQPGLELLSQKKGEFAKWTRRLSVISLNMIWVLLKIGVQVTSGLGSVVPDISNLASGLSMGISVATINVLDQLKLEVEKNVTLVNDDRSFDEAWCGLRDYLGPYLTSEKCAELFRLHFVTYRNRDDPYAWLCEPCMSSARRNFLLE